jgi:DNA modification methylase
MTPRRKEPPAWRNRIVGHGDEAPDQLLANPRNWRVHPKHQQDALGGVLDQVGFVQSVIVNQRTGYVVDGHARIALAITCQQPTVPVVYVDLDDAEEKLILATLDPLAALAGADDGQLAALLAEVSTSDDALSQLLRDLAPPVVKQLNPDDADLTPPAEPTTQPGDLWLLGEHRLLCGDATSAEDVVRLLDGARPPLLVTDPPYGVEFDPGWRKKLGAVKDEYMDSRLDTERGWRLAWEHAPCEVAYIWHSDKQRRQLEDALLAVGWTLRQEIVWVKEAWAMSRTLWAYRHEACLFLTRGETHWTGPRNPQGHNAMEHTTVWNDKPVSAPFGSESDDVLDDADSRHAAQKPVALMRRPLQHHAGDVYEPFAGSGTTLIAAETEDRSCFALEMDARFCDVIVRRWEHVTGRRGERVGATDQVHA